MNTCGTKGVINDIKVNSLTLFRGFEFSYRYLKLILVMNIHFLHIDFPTIDKHLILSLSVCIFVC